MGVRGRAESRAFVGRLVDITLSLRRDLMDLGMRALYSSRSRASSVLFRLWLGRSGVEAGQWTLGPEEI